MVILPEGDRSMLVLYHKDIGIDMERHFLYISGVIKSTLVSYPCTSMVCDKCFHKFTRLYLGETPESFTLIEMMGGYNNIMGLVAFKVEHVLSEKDHHKISSLRIKPICAGCLQGIRSEFNFVDDEETTKVGLSFKRDFIWMNLPFK